MSKTRDTGFLGNVVKYDANGNVNIVSGSTTLLSVSSSGQLTVPGNEVITGSLTVLGGITGAITGSATSASYAANTSLLNGSGSGEFVPTGSFNTFSSSVLTYTGSVNSQLSALQTTSGSNITRISALESASGSAITRLSALEVTSGSNITRLSSLEAKTGSYAATGSNTFDGGQYLSSSFNPTGFSTTASLYTDGGLRVTKDAYISGTLYLNNVTVYGTQSVAYITSSQLNISTNLISVNTDTPSVRFGGLSVYDSGSTGLTGSILWDSENNRWIYSNPSGSGYSGGMFISGPRAASLGTEVGTTSCALMMGQGGDHITSSAIFSYGNATCFYGQSYISGSGDTCFAGSIQSSILCSNTINLSGNNNALACNNTLRFTDTDTATEANQQIGKIEFFSCDSSTPGAGVKAYIGAFAQDTTPDAYLSFATQDGSATPNPVERLRISSEGITCFASTVCAPAFVGGTVCGTSTYFNINSTSNVGFFQGNDGTTTLGNSFNTVHRNANDGNGRYSLSRWQTQNSSGLDQSAFIGVQAVAGVSNYNPNLVLGISTGASSYATYLTIANTGVASFTCQICTIAAVTADLRYTGTGYITYDTSASGTSCLIFRQNGTEKMRISECGYVAVTGNEALSCVPYLQGMSFGWNRTNGQGESMINWTNAGGGNACDLVFNFRDSTTLYERLRIASTGAATFSSTIQNVSGVYVRASGNSDLPFINFSNADGVYNWGRVGGLLQGDGDGALYFQTKLGGGLTEKLRITSAGVACFSNNVCALGLNLTGASDAVLDMVAPGATAYIKFKNACNSTWGIGASFIGRTCNLDVYNFATNINVLTIDKTGVACFASSICAFEYRTGANSNLSKSSIRLRSANDNKYLDFNSFNTCNVINSNYGDSDIPLILGTYFGHQANQLFLATNCNVGIGTNAPSQKLHINRGGFLQTDGNSSWYRNVFERNVTSWDSVVGFSPQSSPQYTYGYINITASAYNNGTSAGGVTTSRWYYSITNNSISVSVVGSDIVTGSQAPSIRLIVSSGTIYVQVQSTNGVAAAYTTVFVDAMLASGYVNGTYWIIA